MYPITAALCLGHILIVLQGEVEHRRVKNAWPRTNKNRKAHRQIASEVQRADVLNKISARNGGSRKIRTSRDVKKRKVGGSRKRMQLRFDISQPLPQTSPRDHFHISEDQRNWVKLSEFAAENADDPACEVRT